MWAEAVHSAVKDALVGQEQEVRVNCMGMRSFCHYWEVQEAEALQPIVPEVAAVEAEQFLLPLQASSN